VARSVGRPPRLDFTELVLCNWNVKSEVSRPAEPDGESGELAQAELKQRRGPPPLKLHVVLRFLASPDEEWYRGIHILLHEEARDVVAAIRAGQVAMRSQTDRGVVGSMVALSSWLNKFCDFFDAYFEQKDSRTESVMIRRLEPFISHSSAQDLTWEETACWIFWSGSSAILPAVHFFLGVRICAEMKSDAGNNGLARNMRQMLEEMRMTMPLPHRAFLEELEGPGASLRQYCFRRFGSRAVPVELLHDLEVGYNDSLNALVRFMSRRVHLVCRLFPQFASSFSAYHAEVEATMRRSRLQLLKMRQRVDRCLEK